MTCECKVCKRHREWERMCDALGFDKGQRVFIDGLYGAIENAETESEWFRANLDGTWPNSEENMRRWGWVRTEEPK